MTFMSTTQAIQGFQISPQQSACWSALHSQDHGLNAVISISVKGPMDPERLRHSLAVLVQRHEALRTTFCVPLGMKAPLQIIQKPYDVEIHEINLDTLAETERETVLDRYFREELSRSWNYEEGRLFAVCLLRFAEGSSELLVTLPALCADKKSLHLLAGELAMIYGGKLPEPEPLQYADAAGYLQELAGSKDSLLLGPREKSAPGEGADPLPFGKGLYAGAAQWPPVKNGINAETVRQLERTALTCTSSIAAVLQACVDALFHRLGVHSELIFGIAEHGRSEVEFERCVGPFSRYVPRPRNTAGVRLRDFIEYWKAIGSDSVSPGSAPDAVWPFLFEYSMTPALPSEGGVIFSIGETQAHTVLHKLGLVCRRNQDDFLETAWYYDSAAFERSDIEKLSRYFVRTMEAAATSADLRVAELEILEPSEQDWLLRTVNATREDFGVPKALHELFELQVLATPEAPAVVDGTRTLTYAQLNAQSDWLADRLRKDGVSEGSRICICMRRSLEMVISIVAVLKAGGCYVPVDPDDATERQAHVIQHSNPVVVLAGADVQVSNALCPVMTVVAEDRESHTMTTNRCAVHPQSPAYILYTSGSTGVPKGVVVSHRAAVNHMLWMQRAFPLSASDRVLQKTPFQFDASVWEFHSPLAAGACLVMAPPDLHRDPVGLNSLMKDKGITRVQVVPTLLRELLADRAGFTEIATLRDLFCGGESLPPELVRRFHEVTSIPLHNLYGPTETTIDATVHTFSPTVAEDPSPIGSPVANSQVYLLNESYELMPTGLPGEIFIGGAGVGTGYHGEASMTAERFLPDCFGGLAGSRMYRTGDIGRYRSDGVLLYHGRSDNQVKFRGYRVELGEVESRLEKHPAVSQGVAIVISPQNGGQQLFAYLLQRPGRQRPSSLELRNSLAASLPSYMIPSDFIWMEKMPLLPSGKVDRKSLPAVRTSQSDYAPPTTPEQEILAAVWSQVLGIDQVGIRDNFFVMGGDSIRTVQVLALAQKSGLHLTLQNIFDHQTIAELAEVSGAENSSAPVDDGVPFSLVRPDIKNRIPSDVEDAYPLTALQLGMLYHLESFRGRAPYHNVNSWHCRAKLNAEMLDLATQEVVARHPNLRTAFELTKYGEPLQLVYKSAVLTVTVIDIRHLSHDQQDTLLDEFVEQERRRLFDLSHPPLMRFHIHRRSNDTFQFTLAECHAISDGWSVTSTIAEIYERYLAHMDGGPLALLPPVPTSMREFLLLEKAALESEETRNFWFEYVGQITPMLLPSGLAPNHAQPEIVRKSINIGQPLVEGMRRLARKARVPLKNAFLAAHVKVVSLFTGANRDVVVGLTSHGRPERSGGTDVRGLFLNMLPFHMELLPESWMALAQRTFMEERKLLQHRRYPLGAIQKLKGNVALFESTFNFVNFYAMNPALNSGTLDILQGYKDSTSSSFPLQTAFSADATSPRGELVLEYDSSRFSAAQVAMLTKYYLDVMEEVAASPDALASARDFTPPELRRLVEEANPGPTQYPSDTTLCELFRAQAAASPHAVAIRRGEVEITFRELDSYSDHLALQMQNMGAGPLQLIAVYMERSPQLLAGILAILKTGAAFVPLERSSPLARLGHQLQSCKPMMLLTMGSLPAIPNLPEKVLTIPENRPALLSAESPRPVSIHPEDLAYIMFTSGSTGGPKAIAVEHRGLVNYLWWAVHYYRMSEGNGSPLHSPISVDLSITSLFAPLLAGKPVEIVAESPGIESLRASVRKNADYSFVKLTPMQLRLLGESIDMENASNWTRCFIIGGEQLTSYHLSPWQKVHPPVTFVNEYGPTETIVGCSVQSGSTSDAVAGNVPIGKPIANARMYVLDGNLCPVPAGVIGDLYIAGDGVARGYFARPDLTAASFIPDHLSPAPGARMYRSGDRGRYLEDLSIEYVGRGDTQVKIRGFRAELSEIEEVAATCPGIRSAVAVMNGSGENRQQLVLYWVRNPENDIVTQQLRDFLIERLPPFMSPGVLIELPSLPMLASGKVDRNSLPAPEKIAAWTMPDLSPSTNEIESVIHAIWKEVLHLEQIGVDQNFFEVGGDSISVYLVHKKLQEKQVGECSVVDLFRYPTIRELGAFLLTGKAPGEALETAPAIRTDAIADNRNRRKERLKRAAQ
jgi:amino acid adenylation domain-containing protein